jgi:hypothetical protein
MSWFAKASFPGQRDKVSLRDAVSDDRPTAFSALKKLLSQSLIGRQGARNVKRNGELRRALAPIALTNQESAH